jgi:hypothetical protein
MVCSSCSVFHTLKTETICSSETSIDFPTVCAALYDDWCDNEKTFAFTLPYKQRDISGHFKGFKTTYSGLRHVFAGGIENDVLRVRHAFAGETEDDVLQVASRLHRKG